MTSWNKGRRERRSVSVRLFI